MSLYGALHIVCQHIICIALHYAHQKACPRGSHQFNFQFCSPEVDQGARGILPTVCAYSFSIYRFRLVRYVLPDYVGLGPKLHTCILFIVYVHYMFMNASTYIRFNYQNQLNQVFNSSISSASYFSYFSIDILRFSFSIPSQLYTC